MLGLGPARRRVLVGAAIAAMIAGAVACTDIFHGTDFPTLCTQNPAAAGCAPHGPSITNVCAESPQAAADRALHACSWLAACEGPLGDNAPGRCLAHALPIFDCTVTPNMLAHDEVRSAWLCLLNAASCDDVDRCLFPSGIPDCDPDGSGTFTRCSDQDGGPSVRLDCRTRGARFKGELCIAAGRTCAEDSAFSRGVCNPGPALVCDRSGCDGTVLHVCDGATDLGVDCGQFGAGQCTESAIAGGVCVATGGATCNATSEVRCEGNVAVGCPSGVEERVDCTALSGPSSCHAIPQDADAKRSFDVSRACESANPCTDDTCTDGALQACVHGRAIPMPCPGGKACTTATTGDGTTARPTCPTP